MTRPVYSRSPRYHVLKKRALEVFKRNRGWLSPLGWAVLAAFYPTRAAYSYLLRLHRFGLLERRRSAGLVLYQLSHRGKLRLEWLERVLRP